MCGSVSESSSPHSPYFLKANGLLSRLPVIFSSSATSAGGGLPSYFASMGLGSSRSTCDGPPCMNSEITAFVFAVKCGVFGVTSCRSAIAAGAFSASRADSARPPKPPPSRHNASRRFNGVSTSLPLHVGKPEQLTGFDLVQMHGLLDAVGQQQGPIGREASEVAGPR